MKGTENMCRSVMNEKCSIAAEIDSTRTQERRASNRVSFARG